MRNYLLVTVITAAMLLSCSKEPGEGGSATIEGKVFVHHYTSSFAMIQKKYYAQNERVYLIYGEKSTYDDNFKTSFDGTFKFKYLREGKYKIFAYSADSTQRSPSGRMPVIREVEIRKSGEHITLPDLIIAKTDETN